MTTAALANAVADRGLYRKPDGASAVTAFQVHGRTRQYGDQFERDGARVRLRSNASRKPQRAARRYLMYQRRQDQWEGDEAEGLEGEPLSHAASNAGQFLDLTPRDRLYIVGQEGEQMLLLGCMDIGRVMSRREAEVHFGGPVYEAEHHVIGEDCTPERFDRIVPERIARSIISERGARIAFASDSEYQLLPSSLQPRLWLTEQSARAPDRLLDAEQRPSEEPLELLAELENRGGSRGRRLNARQNRAVELRAIGVAKQHYEAAGWDVEDVSATRSFDLLCTREHDRTLLVEVKGTSGASLDEVAFTRNEVSVARRNTIIWQL
jgi:hypothetical protein